MLKPVLAVLALGCGAVPALAFAERFHAESDCAATRTELVYDCVIRLSENGAPVEGAVFEVKAEMPSMPMAHNLVPVPAEPLGTPGSYRVPLRLEMHGRWTLRLGISAPRRDLVIVSHEFLPDGEAGTATTHNHTD